MRVLFQNSDKLHSVNSYYYFVWLITNYAKAKCTIWHLFHNPFKWIFTTNFTLQIKLYVVWMLNTRLNWTWFVVCPIFEDSFHITVNEYRFVLNWMKSDDLWKQLNVMTVIEMFKVYNYTFAICTNYQLAVGIPRWWSIIMTITEITCYITSRNAMFICIDAQLE